MHDVYIQIWCILLLAGGGLMMVSFFTPWWRAHFEKDGIRNADDGRRAMQAVVKKAKWYNSYDLRVRDGSAWVWGWNTGVGITAFILSFPVIAWGIVPWVVRLLRRWAWIGFFTGMVMGLLTFILNLVWYFTAPSKDVSGILTQTVIAGPYLLMLGSLTVFVGGLLGGIFGLMAFLKTKN